MKSLAYQRVSELSREITSLDVHKRSYRRWLFALMLCSVSASVTGLFGLAIAGASLLHIISAEGRFSNIGVVLLMITFPLLILAAHFLDRIDDANHAIRMSAYKHKIDEFNEVDRLA